MNDEHIGGGGEHGMHITAYGATEVEASQGMSYCGVPLYRMSKIELINALVERANMEQQSRERRMAAIQNKIHNAIGSDGKPSIIRKL